MTYRFKPTEVEALRIPAGLTVNLDITEAGHELPTGTKVQGGEWLVALDDKLVAFTEGDFEAQFEPVNGRALPRAVRKPKLPRKPPPKPKKLCAPAPPQPKAQAGGRTGQLIIEALSEKARTVGELIDHCKKRGRDVNKPRVSCALSYLKRQGRVETNGFGEWRLL